MEITFRQSELWESCRRRWALSYRKGLVRARRRPGKADVGDLVHKGLEVIYGGDGLWLPSVEALWEEGALTIEDKPEWVKNYADALVLAKIMLKGYEDWLAETGADAGWEVQSVERQLDVPFMEVDTPYGLVSVRVTGRTDLEVLDEWGDNVLVDHKTRDALAPSTADRLDLQRPTYAVLRMLEDQTFYRAATHNVLRRVKRTAQAKPPFYGRNEVHYSVDKLRKHHRHMTAKLQEMVPMAAAIEAGALPLDDPKLYPTPTRDCSWRCPFLDVCEMFDDGSDWEWSVNELYVPSATLEITPGEEN